MLKLKEKEAKMRHRNQTITPMNQKGFTILEIVVALALIGLIVPLVLGGLSAATLSSDRVYDRSLLFELAQSQLEAIESQPYQDSTADAYSLISAPPGYSISVQADDVLEYEYPDPIGVPTQETLQEVIVTVTGVRGNLTIRAYKVRR